MKLKYIILRHLALTLSLLLTVWAVLFYMAMINEVNDETDDALDEYAEHIITRALAGETLPSKSDGSNNTYYIREVSKGYAKAHKKPRYTDEMIYLEHKRETEPGRILTLVYRDKHNQYYELVVTIPTIEKEDLKEAILWYIVILYFLLLMAILLVNLLVFRKAMRPLYTLLEWLENYIPGEKNKALNNPTDVVEFAQLNQAAQEHALRTEALFKQQQLFIGNASHELQTPIAICQSRLELLAEQELSEQQMIEVAKIQQTLSYMARLNRTLLLLSKIDNNQFAATKAVRIDQLTDQLMGEYKEVYAHKQITVHQHLTQPLSWMMDESLAQMMIGNLIKNAFVHNYKGGEVWIETTPQGVTITNSGEATALESERIYDLFYQKVKQEHSTGLGLALTKSICTSFQLTIDYQYLAGKHTFTIAKQEDEK